MNRIEKIMLCCQLKFVCIKNRATTLMEKKLEKLAGPACSCSVGVIIIKNSCCDSPNGFDTNATDYMM